MPAKECSFGLPTLPEKETTTHLQFKDVDNLVKEIKENLKLSHYDPGVYSNNSGVGSGGGISSSSSGALKVRSYLSSRGSRNSPYVVPDRLKAANKCDCDGAAGEGGRKGSWAARKRYPSMSANGKQKLDKLDDPLEMLHELISEGNLLKEAVRRLQIGLTPKIQRNFYDSDEDCRTPVHAAPVANYATERVEIGI